MGFLHLTPRTWQPSLLNEWAVMVTPWICQSVFSAHPNLQQSDVYSSMPMNESTMRNTNYTTPLPLPSGGLELWVQFLFFTCPLSGLHSDHPPAVNNALYSAEETSSLRYIPSLGKTYYFFTELRYFPNFLIKWLAQAWCFLSADATIFLLSQETCQSSLVDSSFQADTGQGVFTGMSLPLH